MTSPIDLAPVPALAPGKPAPAPALTSCVTGSRTELDLDALAADYERTQIIRHSFWTHLNALGREYERMEAEVHLLQSQRNLPIAESDSSSQLNQPVPSDRDATSDASSIADLKASVIIDAFAEPVSPIISTAVADYANGTCQPDSIELIVNRASSNSEKNTFSEQPSEVLSRENLEQSWELGQAQFVSENVGKTGSKGLKQSVLGKRVEEDTEVLFDRFVSENVGKTGSKGLKQSVLGKGVEEDTEVLFDRVATMEVKKIHFAESLRGKITPDFLVSSFMDLVIVSNIFLLGFQAGSMWTGWLVVDSLYAALFCLEIFYRIMLQKQQYCNIHNPDFKWHIFDIALAVLSVFDVVLSYYDSSSTHDSNYTWIRMARLIRIARVLRLLQLDMFRDLLLMINGAVGGLRTLAWSIVMITMPIYVFALFYTELVGVVARGEDDVANNFSSIGNSMFTGFRCLVVGDCSQEDGTPIFVHLVKEYGWMYGVVYAITSVCMSFGLFNVIIAIYVENTVAAAKSNELIQRQRYLEDQSHFFARIVDLLHFLWRKYPKRMPQFNWEDAMGLEVTEEYFKDLLELPKMRMLLSELDVPKEDHADLFEICDADSSGTVTMDELVAGIRRLRGDPRRSDIVYVMLRVREVLAAIQELREFVLKPCKPSERRRFISNDSDQIRSQLKQSLNQKSEFGAEIQRRPGIQSVIQSV